METLRDKAAIIGIGETDFSTNSGRTELKLAVQATLAACEDAGIEPTAIDGMVRYDMDEVDQLALATTLGVANLRFIAETGYGGGGACTTVILAAMAVATGQADVVLCWRSLNEYSGRRFGQPQTDVIRVGGEPQFHRPYGIMSPAQLIAMVARRHMFQYGTTSRQFGSVTMNSRAYASNNPRARFYKRPLTWDEYDLSRVIADPIRTYDCCLESDGAVAILVSRAQSAGDFRQQPVYVMGGACSSGRTGATMVNFYVKDMTVSEECQAAGEQLWRIAGVGPKEIDVAQVYDHFSPLVLMALEDYGFVKKGESGPWVESGALGPGGDLPTNTAGGLVGEAYIHGMNLISEAVRQIRGTSPNQVANAELSFVSAGNGVPTSALILRK